MKYLVYILLFLLVSTEISWVEIPILMRQENPFFPSPARSLVHVLPYLGILLNCCIQLIWLEHFSHSPDFRVQISVSYSLLFNFCKRIFLLRYICCVTLNTSLWIPNSCNQGGSVEAIPILPRRNRKEHFIGSFKLLNYFSRRGQTVWSQED